MTLSFTAMMKLRSKYKRADKLSAEGWDGKHPGKEHVLDALATQALFALEGQIFNIMALCIAQQKEIKKLKQGKPK